MTPSSFTSLPWNASIARYEAQAAQLLAAHSAGLPEALELLHRSLPRFLDDTITWQPKPLTPEQIRETPLDLDDARLAVARLYSFRDWDALSELVAAVAAVAVPGSDVRAFEQAADAVIDGDVVTLRALLEADPTLVHRRSTRVTCHDPPVHGATLLHYLGANGVEGYRQRSPANATEIARLLLEAGAEPDATAGMYGGDCATLSMLVSSSPPAEAGVQVPLTHVLIDFGADVEGVGTGAWRSPLLTALVFGFRDVGEALVARGARVDDVVKAAGLGRADVLGELLPSATADARHRGLAMGAINGHREVVERLLAAGEDPNRLNPDGMHAHSTPLHQAALAGHLGVVEVLVAHGARTDIRDTVWHGTPLGWAEHGEQAAVAAFLRPYATPGEPT